MIFSIRSITSTSTMAMAIGLAMAGCSQSNGANESTGSEGQNLYLLGTPWPNGVVPVCFDGTNGNNPTLLGEAQRLLANSWGLAAKITFTGWGQCDYSNTSPNFPRQVAISFASGTNGGTGNHQVFCFPSPSNCGPGGSDVTLISDDPDPFQQHFRYEVIHEFGHVLGFAHEQERPDNFVNGMVTFGGCSMFDPSVFTGPTQKDGGTYETAYDPNSIMNYCATDKLATKPMNPAFVTFLSAGDIEGVRKVPGYVRDPNVHGFMIRDARNIGALAINGQPVAQGATVTMVTGCSIDEPNCTWSFRRGMIVSDADPTFAINAWGGAAEGTALRLNNTCDPTNPDCTFTWSKGEFLSDRNPSLAINANNGARNNAPILLAGACRASNPDCAWMMSSVMLSSYRNTSLNINAWGGASNGQNLKLNDVCTTSNPDCTWTFLSDGRIVSTRNNSLALNAWGGALDGNAVRPNTACTPSNPDCTWTWSHGQIISDDLNNGVHPINAFSGAAVGTSIVLESACTAANEDCVFDGIVAH